MGNYKVMDWQEVFKRHPKINSIYRTKNGVVSLLFSKDRRRRRINKEVGNKLLFYFSPQSFPGDINAMKKAFKDQNSIQVYYKESPDKWIDKGFYIIDKIYDGFDDIKRESLIFELVPKQN